MLSILIECIFKISTILFKANQNKFMFIWNEHIRQLYALQCKHTYEQSIDLIESVTWRRPLADKRVFQN